MGHCKYSRAARSLIEPCDHLYTGKHLGQRRVIDRANHFGTPVTLARVKVDGTQGLALGEPMDGISLCDAHVKRMWLSFEVTGASSVSADDVRAHRNECGGAERITARAILSGTINRLL